MGWFSSRPKSVLAFFGGDFSHRLHEQVELETIPPWFKPRHPGGTE
jgi:hypothetical protein